MSTSKKPTTNIDSKSLIDELPAICIIIDCQFNIVSINKNGYQHLGYHPSELIGQSTLLLYSEEQRTVIEQKLSQVLNNNNKTDYRWECHRTKKDNSRYWAKDSCKLLNPSAKTKDKHILILSEDFTEVRYLISELEKKASIDPLTGVYNRSIFEKHLEQAILSTFNKEHQHSLCYIDLDQFKVVNDVSGHLAGDELLQQIAQLIKSNVRSNDIFARLGGDEFGLLLMNTNIEEAQEIAQKILNAILKFHFRWGDNNYSIGASIGICLIDKMKYNIQEYMQQADSSCYAAKEHGRKTIKIYNESNSQIKQKSRLQHFASCINWALENNRFVLYQQQIQATTQGDDHQRLEILLRMKDENDVLISPAEFIPAAEYYNLTTLIDLWVTEKTMEYFASQTLSQAVICNINLSGNTLSSSEFMTKASLLLKDLKPQHLTICFEITETAAIENLHLAIDFIKHFKSLGCLFALDDFGSGFSSFSYLKNLDVEYLKIDGYFIKNMMSETKDLAIVRSIQQISQAFNLKTVAEFVENEEILQELKKFGVHYAQGYHLHKPEPLIKN